MSRADLAQSNCSVARTIERVGEPWSLMILREMFLGSRRFDDLQRHTGASPHILSERLKQMCADGILQKRAYCDHPRRYEYLLTAKGRDLWPVIIALRNWGETWLGRETAVQLRHKGCGQPTVPHMVCSDCGEPMQAHDCLADVAPVFKAERNIR